MRTYRRPGFALCKGRFEVFPDQLGVELLFVAELLERCGDGPGDDTDAELPAARQGDQALLDPAPGALGTRLQSADRARRRAFLLSGKWPDFSAASPKRKSPRWALRPRGSRQGRAVVPKSEIQVEFNPDEPVCGACPAGDAANRRQGRCAYCCTTCASKENDHDTRSALPPIFTA